MSRQPRPPAPKPCYGLDFDLSEQVCIQCPFKKGCFEALGSRQQTVTLNKTVFSFVPRPFRVELDKLLGDPELPLLERTYVLCYQTIFGRNPPDRIGPNHVHLAKRIHLAECSARLYMLTLMIAHIRHKEIIAGETGALRKTPFTTAKLLAKNAPQKLNDYRAMCRKEFGTFDLGSLDLLVEGNFSDHDFDRRLLHSEIIAGRFVVGFKIRQGGSYLEALFSQTELSLDPYWLAIEPTYEETIFEAYLKGTRGTPAQNRHRHSVGQVVKAVKKKKDFAIGLHQARERIAPRAVVDVLHHFGYKPADFEIENNPVTSMLEFWVLAARAIQHHKCLQYATGETATLKL